MAVEEEPPPSVAYMQALQKLLPLFNSWDFRGLIRGAWRAGVVQGVEQPVTAAELGDRLGRSPELVARVLDALVAHEVVDESDGGRHVVSDAWRPLLLQDPPLDLLAVMRYSDARARMLEDAVTGGEDYWATGHEDRAAYALGVAVDPESRHAVEMVSIGQALNPVVSRLLEAGGSFLELGCGAAGSMCVVLQLHPRVSAVGVELSEDLVALARARAERLGLTDRMEVVHGDAATLDRPDAFEFAFWSQFFFPDHARAGALAVLLRALRPGGVVMAPLMAEPATGAEQLRTDDGREYAADRVLHGSWGVPHRSPDGLKRELEHAGFDDAQLLELPYGRVVWARRP